MSSDLYQVLGVKRAATGKDIQRAYRRKAKTLHPDGGGSVEAFNELVTAYVVLSDRERRERYDCTGEVEPPRPDNRDGAALEVIAQKLGIIIHADQDVMSLDVAALIERAIREDIAERRSNISHQRRAAGRAMRLRVRAKRKTDNEDNLLAVLLGWHELSTENHIKNNEEAVRCMERALDILRDYSFTDDLALEAGDDVSGALTDILEALDELAVVLDNTHGGAEAIPAGAAPSAYG